MKTNRLTTGAGVLAPALALGCSLMFMESLKAAPPGREGGLPPGLQKKEKLPPGWQKKVGDKPVAARESAPATEPAKPSGTVTPATTTPPSGQPAPSAPSSPSAPSATSKPEVAAPETAKPQPTTPSTSSTASPSATSNPATISPAGTQVGRPLTREQRENLARMERALADLEVQAVRPGAPQRMLQRLSNQHNISVASLEAQWKRYPGLSAAQFYLAAVVAKDAKVPYDHILQERKSGRSWSDIISSHKVSFGDMTERLRTAEELAKEGANSAAKAQPR